MVSLCRHFLFYLSLVCMYCAVESILIFVRLQDIKSIKVAAKKMLTQVVHTIYQTLVVKATQMLKEMEVSILVLDSPHLLKHAVHDFNLSMERSLMNILHTSHNFRMCFQSSSLQYFSLFHHSLTKLHFTNRKMHTYLYFAEYVRMTWLHDWLHPSRQIISHS